ncbi:MAG: DUF2694 family protein [Mycobacterium sp.]
MSSPDPAFDAAHPSGHLVFRSCRGGYLHSVALADAAMEAEAAALARAVLLAAQVSHLKAVMRIRQEIVSAGFTPSAGLPAPADLDLAEQALRQHALRPGG